MSRTKERLTVFKIVFSSLYQDFLDYNEFALFVKSEPILISDDQMQLLTNLFQQKDFYIKKIQSLLKINWKWERLSKIEQAVLLVALSEAETWKTEKAVIINESLVTIKKYGSDQHYKYINAVLDRAIV